MTKSILASAPLAGAESRVLDHEDKVTRETDSLLEGWREADSNPRSPVWRPDVGHPVRPLQDKNAGCSSMLEAPRTARSRC
jgi:hypothetical protein